MHGIPQPGFGVWSNFCLLWKHVITVSPLFFVCTLPILRHLIIIHPRPHPFTPKCRIFSARHSAARLLSWHHCIAIDGIGQVRFGFGVVVATADPAAVVVTSDLVAVSSVVGCSGKRRMLHGTLSCSFVDNLRFPRRISRLGENDSRSTAWGVVLGVAVAT